MPQPEVVILGGARTPMAEYVGAFKDLSAIDLGARAAAAALERSGVSPGWVDNVVMATRCRPRATRSTARATWASRPACPSRCPRSR